jgi:hypothetical protein
MPKNNEQLTTNIIQNKPNQSQFQTQKQLTLLSGREIARPPTGPGVWGPHNDYFE